VDLGLVSYGTRENEFGKFVSPIEGILCGLRIEHVSGYVLCNANQSCKSNWACHTEGLDKDFSQTIVSNSENKPLFPKNFYDIEAHWNSYPFPGLKDRDQYLEFEYNHSYCSHVSIDESLRIWYGPDFNDNSEGDNSGTHKVHIYGYYKQGISIFSISKFMESITCTWKII